MEAVKCTLQDQWGLRDVRIAGKIESKGSRSIYIVECCEGKFALKQFAPSLPEASIRQYTHALLHMQGRGLKLSPSICTTMGAELYVRHDDTFLYLMEFVEGEPLRETPEDEYDLGQASALLHTIADYPHESGLNVKERIAGMYDRFHDYPFKREYDRIVDDLPDFESYRQSFIHTDIGPHNAMRADDGRIVFLDFDDAGSGSPLIDAGYPLICQFVRFQEDGSIRFDSANAKAFYAGYLSQMTLSEREKEIVFDGAVFMQLMYMPCYGDEGVLPMWKLLQYALEHKEELLASISGHN